MENVEVGLMRAGLNTYWSQFDGLLTCLNNYQKQTENRMESYDHVEVVDTRMVDDIKKADGTALLMKREDVGVLFILTSTYALPSMLIPIASRLDVPVTLLNLQPLPTTKYDKLNSMSSRGMITGEWLVNCQTCSIPEHCAVFGRVFTKYNIASGYLDDEEAREEISHWLKAIRAARNTRQNRVGILDNHYGGMVDAYSDLKLQNTVFSTHVEVPEMCELAELRQRVARDKTQWKTEEFKGVFVTDEAYSKDKIERVAQTSAASDKLIEKYRLGSMAYYYSGMNGDECKNIITPITVGNTLLTGRNIPIVGEYEVRNVQTVKITAPLGIEGCFSEFCITGFNDDIVMLGHDGSTHFIISENKVHLVPLPAYHGKPDKELPIQMSAKQGSVTLLSMVEGKEGISFLISEGESVPGPILNTRDLSNRYKFPILAKELIG